MDRRLFLAAAVAVYTGMRQGEIRALKIDSFEFPSIDKAEDQAIIVIKKSFVKEAKFKSPKGRKIRKTPAPKWLCQELQERGKNNPYKQDIIFYSDVVPDVPVRGLLFFGYNIATRKQAEKIRSDEFGSEGFISTGIVVSGQVLGTLTSDCQDVEKAGDGF